MTGHRHQKTQKIIQGDCLEKLADIADQSIDLVLTSPPYAEQRRGQYPGVEETDYPAYMVKVMRECRRVLKPLGNVLLNLHPNVRDGDEVEWVNDTVREVRLDGWRRRLPVYWGKPNAPPLGNTGMLRPAVELIHWFSLDRRSYCSPTAGGPESDRLGLVAGRKRPHIHGGGEPKQGVARLTNLFLISTTSGNKVTEHIRHPARMPLQLAMQLIPVFCPRHGTTLDPFVGSGTVAEAAFRLRHDCIGIEIDGGTVNSARLRLRDARMGL